MSYITTDNITSINAELSNYCNAACPMCARFFIDGKLNKEKVNSIHTTLCNMHIEIEEIKKETSNLYGSKESMQVLEAKVLHIRNL